MDKAKKKRIKKYGTWIAMAAVVVLLTLMPLMAKAEVEAEGPVASILSGTVTTGTVSTSLRGGGTISTNDAQDVKLPSGVKITEFLVKNGDVVSEGDPVAAVDKVSVMTAIVEVKDTLKYLEKEIQSVRNETVRGTISATAGGRVKQVFAQVGDSVQDVMLEHGALAVLSLDGLMAVEIQGYTDLTTGDAVIVTMTDGRQAEGRVESNLDGVLIITVEDEGYGIGEAVTVTDENGSDIGAGTLYIHNAWKATAFTGTVSAVYAVVEKSVSAGSSLFILKDTQFTAELEYMSNQHREYEELMQDLFRMHESGFITAPCDGVVSGVDPDSTFLLAGEKVDWTAVPLENEASAGWTVMLLSAEAPIPDTDGAGGEGGESGGSGDGGESGEGGTGTGGESSGTTYNAIAAMVKEVGSNGLILKKSSMPGTATKTVTVDEEGNSKTAWTYSEGLLDTKLMLTTEVLPVGDPSAYKPGDLLVFIYDESGNPLEIVYAGSVEIEGGNQGGGFGGFGGFMGGFDISGLLGGMMGGMGGYGAAGGAAENTTELFDLEGEVLMTVTPQDSVSLTIAVDQKDISRVSLGQLAEVTLEALRGQTLEGEVVQIGTSGTNNGGSSKFSVKLELPYVENMLDGMSATAELTQDTKLDALVLPVEALVENGARTVVYTALDEKTGEPINPVEVTIGLSDGIHAEILSGLQLGDPYYYSYYDILELDTSVNTQKYTFG